MGTLHFLTNEQKIILDKVKGNNTLAPFYFTGGTALSAIYLQHRYSEDLDFFSEKKIDKQRILNLIDDWSKSCHFTFTAEFNEVVYMFFLKFKNNVILKVDFGYYPYRSIKENVLVDGLQTDSLDDIAVNKLFTIVQRTTEKDFVDLYFLLQQFSLWDLIEGVRRKFRMKLDPLILSSDLLKVEEFTFLPHMIKPLTLDELKLFYREKALEIGKKAVSS